ncbi:MAG TPA: hypothetical protein VLE53_18945 [Gemmatimonadaceae bacterium]|nr:hypothetical protein [Gemmatimonadaceae bacterium]
MLLLILPALVVAALIALYVRLKRQSSERALWHAAIRIGLGLGVLRALLATTGWYIVEHSGGPLQIPAYALAMLAWPEGAMLAERRTAPAPVSFHVALAALIILTTAAAVITVALLTRIPGRTRD